MLREEQIDLRRQRARAANFTIENLGKNRVFSDYRVRNPLTKGEYKVSVRGLTPATTLAPARTSRPTPRHLQAHRSRAGKTPVRREPVKRRRL